MNIVLSIFLATVTIALYIPVVKHSFVVVDDHAYVTANPHIHDGFSWSTLKWAFTSTEEANWHPLTWLSHTLDYQLFGLNPAGHHLDSVLIHALNVVLLFLLLEWATKRRGPSLLVAALFALHPINVESVAWVAERKNVLSTLFFFLAVGAYGWYLQRPGWQRYLTVAALFAAGLMAKPMVITLPFVLLLLDYWPLDRTRSNGPSSARVPRLVLEKVPLLILSAVSAVITVRAARSGHAVRTLTQFSLATRIQNAVVAYGSYLWKMLWPTRLAFYPHFAIAHPAREWILSALVLIIVTVFVVAFRRRCYLPVGWFWFLGTSVPTIGLVHVGDIDRADRYCYVPLIGIFVMLAWFLDDWAKAKKARPIWQVIPPLCTLVALGFVTSRQTSYWDSEYDIWSHTLAVAESPPAHEALALALLVPDFAMTQHDLENFSTEQKRMDEARRHFERALDLCRQMAWQNTSACPPYVAAALSGLGHLDLQQQRMNFAREHLEGALEIYRQLAQQDPDTFLTNVPNTLDSLGNLDEIQNQMEEAHRHYEESSWIYRQLARQNPDEYLPHLATTLNILAKLDRLQKQDEARQHLEEALKIQSQLTPQSPDYLPGTAATLINLGSLDQDQNRTDKAREHLEGALQIYRRLVRQNPDLFQSYLAMTLYSLGNLDEIQNQMEEARRHYEESSWIYLQLAQQDPGTYLQSAARTLGNLAFLDKNQNRIEEARVHYQEALSLFQKLFQGDHKYAGDVARVQAGLEELAKKAPAQ